MGRLFREKPSPAMVVALLALFVALGGGAYAVTVAPKNSVRSKSIKDGQVKYADLHSSAVKSNKIADRSVLGRDLDMDTVYQASGNDSAGSSPAVPPGTIITSAGKEVVNFGTHAPLPTLKLAKNSSAVVRVQLNAQVDVYTDAATASEVHCHFNREGYDAQGHEDLVSDFGGDAYQDLAATAPAAPANDATIGMTESVDTVAQPGETFSVNCVTKAGQTATLDHAELSVLVTRTRD